MDKDKKRLDDILKQLSDERLLIRNKSYFKLPTRISFGLDAIITELLEDCRLIKEGCEYLDRACELICEFITILKKQNEISKEMKFCYKPNIK